MFMSHLFLNNVRADELTDLHKDMPFMSEAN